MEPGHQRAELQWAVSGSLGKGSGEKLASREEERGGPEPARLASATGSPLCPDSGRSPAAPCSLGAEWLPAFSETLKILGDRTHSCD